MRSGRQDPLVRDLPPAPPVFFAAVPRGIRTLCPGDLQGLNSGDCRMFLRVRPHPGAVSDALPVREQRRAVRNSRLPECFRNCCDFFLSSCDFFSSCKFFLKPPACFSLSPGVFFFPVCSEVLRTGGAFSSRCCRIFFVMQGRLFWVLCSPWGNIDRPVNFGRGIFI